MYSNGPDTYCGSVDKQTESLWCLDSLTNNVPKLVYRSLEYVPAVCSLFDEMIVNACDRVQVDPTVDEIRVDYSVEEGWVRVSNTGRGVPVQMHPEHNMWIPELIFGHLLTSSNYQSDVKKTTGGKNGLGIKVCNIFSTKFGGRHF